MAGVDRKTQSSNGSMRRAAFFFMVSSAGEPGIAENEISDEEFTFLWINSTRHWHPESRFSFPQRKKPPGCCFQHSRSGVIGLGYVGLPLVIEMAQEGFEVTGIDIDWSKVESVNTGLSCIRDVAVADNFPDRFIPASCDY